jgi:hypothetical protein
MPMALWNNLTSTNSNKIRDTHNKFTSLCYYHVLQLDILRNYDLILNYLDFRTLYSRLRHIDALFIINVSKGKINCHSNMDTVGVRVPARQIREFST